MDIKVYRLARFSGEGNTKAFVDLIVDDTLILKGFTLVEGRTGLFLANPSKKEKDGKYYDTVRFDNLEQKLVVEKSVLEYYNKKQV